MCRLSGVSRGLWACGERATPLWTAVWTAAATVAHTPAHSSVGRPSPHKAHSPDRDKIYDSLLRKQKADGPMCLRRPSPGPRPPTDRRER